MRPHTHRFWLWLVLAGFLLAQAVGVLHRTAHALLPTGNASSAVSARIDGDRAPGSGKDWIHRLVGEHRQGSGDCRLADQTGYGDTLVGMPALVLALVPPLVVAALATGLALARWAALFDARGPPATH